MSLGPGRLAGLALLCLVAWSSALARMDIWQTATQAGVGAFETGKFEQAERHFKKALELSKSFPGDDPSLAEVLKDYSALPREMDRKKKAVKLEARAQAITGG
jgi:tetratricopeptide (TPR) repeat protein